MTAANVTMMEYQDSEFIPSIAKTLASATQNSKRKEIGTAKHYQFIFKIRHSYWTSVAFC